jgi:hypothetical protein
MQTLPLQHPPQLAGPHAGWQLFWTQLSFGLQLLHGPLSPQNKEEVPAMQVLPLQQPPQVAAPQVGCWQPPVEQASPALQVRHA